MSDPRHELIRILGESTVRQAESMPPEDYSMRKWEHLPALCEAFERWNHTPAFEARRSFLLGVPHPLKEVLVRHILETSQPTG